MSSPLLHGFTKACRLAAGSVVHLFAPDYCAACDAPIETQRVFCVACGDCPAPPRWVALGAQVAGGYADPLSTAILRMKFGHRADVADRLGRLLPAPREFSNDTLIVPVPLHYSRLLHRGFNPAALLARQLRRRLGGHCAFGLLRRWRDTPQQSHLEAGERLTNVAGAFSAGRNAVGRSVLLVDDVITTGSTARACTQALYAAGVVHVSVIALAATRERER